MLFKINKTKINPTPEIRAGLFHSVDVVSIENGRCGTCRPTCTCTFLIINHALAVCCIPIELSLVIEHKMVSVHSMQTFYLVRPIPAY